MGTSLTGTKPKDTYDSLIKVTDNGPLSGTAKYLSDGLGNDSVLALSTSRVGVGITSPQGELDVKGSTNVAVFLRNASNGDTNTDGLLLGNIGGIPASYQIWNYENGYLRFGTNGTERLRILSDGGLTFNGDTAQANALDDYEEGTFTPTLTASTSNPTVTYAAGNTGGIYTKVGNKVTVSFEVRWTALSGGSGEVRISGLPFTRRTTTLPDGERGILDSYNNTISGLYLTGTIGSNTNRVDVLNVVSAAPLVAMDVTDLPTASLGLLRGTITYFV